MDKKNTDLLYIKINDKNLPLYPVKMKYMKRNFYSCYLILKKEGLMKIFKYQDGEEVVNELLVAIFDGNKEYIDYAKDNLDEKTMNILLDKIKQINDIDDEADLKNA